MKWLLTIIFIAYTISLIFFIVSLCNYQDTCDMGFTLCITGGISIMGFILFLAISWLFGKEVEEL